MIEFCVLLDNGHGKDTPGKRSPKWPDGTQLLEWEYTRMITERVKERLDSLGIRCVRLVPEDKDISLSSRADRANEYAKKYRCVMVSVHCNASKDGKGHGWEVWSTKSKNNSDKLAKCFIDSFNKCIIGRKNRGHKEENFTVLYKTNCPCVLTENFFMDNKEDCTYMLSDKGIDEIANLHVEAILRYQELYCPETISAPTVVSPKCYRI